MRKVMLVMLLTIALFVVNGCDTGISPDTIEIKAGEWIEKQEGTIFFDYERQHNGVLVTNQGDQTVDVKINAKYYDEKDCYLSQDGGAIRALSPGESCFLFLNPSEEKNVKYECIPEKSKYRAATFSDVSYEFLDDGIKVTNHTDKEPATCLFQFVWYDMDGNIEWVATLNVGDVPAGESVFVEDDGSKTSASQNGYIAEDLEIVFYCYFY